MRPDRRTLLTGALALAACQGRAESGHRAPVALKDAAPFPIGAAVSVDTLSADPAYVRLALRHLDQITPENEMKMGVIVQEDGRLDFGLADVLADFADRHSLRLFGHTLVWHSEEPAAFGRLRDDRAAFERAYRAYVTAVVRRYRGRVVGWDVVNEAVAEDGQGVRGGWWAEVLGEGWAEAAFHHARAADAETVLFLNDYNLERPAKRRTFLRLAEDLLRRGAPLGGLGTQSHIDAGMPPAVLRQTIADLGSLGLPVHVSELDVRLGRSLADVEGEADALARQARAVGALAEAFADLPAAQRFAFTTWGLRDQDSWLTRPPWREAGRYLERPLLLDEAGSPKPAFWAAVDAWSGR